MFRLAAAILLLSATAASAGTVGEDFCDAMQKSYLACGDETVTTNANGQSKAECPDTIRKMASVYEGVKLKAKPDERPSIDRANEVWKSVAYRVSRGLGEGEQQFTERRNKQIQDIVSECEKLGVN